MYNEEEHRCHAAEQDKKGKEKVGIRTNGDGDTLEIRALLD